MFFTYVERDPHVSVIVIGKANRASSTVSDGALVAAASLSNRYITNRFLPDKAIDLVDEAASAQRLQQESKPDAIQELDRKIMTIQIELESLRKETDVASNERKQRLEESLRTLQSEAVRLTSIWDKEKEKLQAIKTAKEQLEQARVDLEKAQREGNFGRASELRYATIPSIEAQLPQENSRDSFQGLIHDTVTADDIGKSPRSSRYRPRC